MQRFTHMLAIGLQEAGYEVDVWTPAAYLGRWSRSTVQGIGKWLGYVDKWVLFPILLRWNARKYKEQPVTFHICDHSNAPYLAHLPAAQTGITCHDILAIRGALGYADAYCPATRMGKLLQRWIGSHLKQAHKLAADSAETLRHLGEYMGEQVPDTWRVIHAGFNGDFSRISADRAGTLMQATPLRDGRPFLLHVGSSLPRKNRKMLVDMLSLLADEWPGVVCFAGQPIDATLARHIESLGLTDRVISVVKPSHELLLALYRTSEAFVFPSLSEGFGWPPVEAQACGAPVIASQIEPMPEVCGEGALFADPHSPEAFADAFRTLQQPGKREVLIRAGYANGERFRVSDMVDAYLDLYGLVRKPETVVYDR